MDRFLVHRFIGFNSLFQYAVHALKLFEAQSYAYITVARKARELPQLQEAIVSGELTVSKAVRITSVINEQTQEKWIGLALELPKRDLEREVARENPRAVRPEQARFLDAHTLQLQTPISEAGYKKLERARELMASGDGEWLSLETVIERLAELYLERKDPVRKAERAHLRETHTLPGNSARAMPQAEKANPSLSVDSDVVPNSAQARSEEQNLKPVSPVNAETLSTSGAALPAAVAHQVHLRDRGRCQARLPDGALCGSSLWVELHHIQPRSQGGRNVADNLTTLCRAHHQAWHAGAFEVRQRTS
ncbi:MAG: HNH endonuclease [Bdellovibrionaceae bacterium]|nr:HNH endonuclease [Pseudobdellovibrionaceae bacterium]